MQLSYYATDYGNVPPGLPCKLKIAETHEKRHSKVLIEAHLMHSLYENSGDVSDCVQVKIQITTAFLPFQPSGRFNRKNMAQAEPKCSYKSKMVGAEWVRASHLAMLSLPNVNEK